MSNLYNYCSIKGIIGCYRSLFWELITWLTGASASSSQPCWLLLVSLTCFHPISDFVKAPRVICRLIHKVLYSGKTPGICYFIHTARLQSVKKLTWPLSPTANCSALTPQWRVTANHGKSCHTFNWTKAVKSPSQPDHAPNYHHCRLPRYSCMLSFRVNWCSAVWWLAGQINVTGSSYKHAQQRAVTAHARPAICPALLPSIRSAAVYTSDSIYSVRPCRLFAADQSRFLASYNLRLCTVWFSRAFGWGRATPCAPVPDVQNVKTLKPITVCQVWQHQAVKETCTCVPAVMLQH